MYENPRVRDSKLNSVAQVKKIFKENSGYQLVGPIDFNPEIKSYSLQIWVEGKNKNASDYVGDIYARNKVYLDLLYKEIYATQ